MKTTIIIALLAFCACNEIQQLPKNHTTVETFKKKKVELKLDDSYPDSWRMNVIDGNKKDPLYPIKNRFYKLSFTDKNGQLRISKHCFECTHNGDRITVNIWNGRKYMNLYNNVYDNITLPDIKDVPIIGEAIKSGRTICYDEMIVKYKASGFLIDDNANPFKCDYIIYNSNKMKLITPEMEKELHAKEINLTD